METKQNETKPKNTSKIQDWGLNTSGVKTWLGAHKKIIESWSQRALRFQHVSQEPTSSILTGSSALYLQGWAQQDHTWQPLSVFPHPERESPSWHFDSWVQVWPVSLVCWPVEARNHTLFEPSLHSSRNWHSSSRFLVSWLPTPEWAPEAKPDALDTFVY